MSQRFPRYRRDKEIGQPLQRYTLLVRYKGDTEIQWLVTGGSRLGEIQQTNAGGLIPQYGDKGFTRRLFPQRILALESVY